MSDWLPVLFSPLFERRIFAMKSFVLALALASALLAVPASAAYKLSYSNNLVEVTDLGAGAYSFSQTGFAQGAYISGSFTGFDLDGDLQLSSFSNEISNFFVSFSGNNTVMSWSSTSGILVFDLNGSSLLGDGTAGAEQEGMSTFDFSPFNAFWDAGPGPYNLCTGGQPCGIVGSEVPEPSSWMMLIAGFGLTGAAVRRRRAVVA